MKKIFAAAAMLLAPTTAFAAAPEAMSNLGASCCAALAACCELALACCG